MNNATNAFVPFCNNSFKAVSPARPVRPSEASVWFSEINLYTISLQHRRAIISPDVKISNYKSLAKKNLYPRYSRLVFTILATPTMPKASPVTEAPHEKKFKKKVDCNI